ncbi:CBO0543 family protein [Desulfosporosinus sp. SB140]|uniref:CBO0543 family protein n=1 Tax=Desulfosporosinus paludis TaxID=3115649 RepID=UPI00388DB87B
MLINILLGFFIPWILGISLYRKDKRILLAIFPVGSLMAFTINIFGFYFEFWNLTPILKEKTMAALPMDLGVYPILGCYLIYLVDHKQWNPFLLIAIFAGLTTVFEFMGVVTGKVVYMNHWNIGWSFVSYFIPYTLEVWYYRILFCLFKKTSSA